MKNIFKNWKLSRSAAAFTLAEVLITLGIIGVVAALTIPTLTKNYQEKVWTTSSSVFERKFTEALKIMNTQDVINSRGTTENFVNELSKYMKISKICDNNNLDKCFNNNFVDSLNNPMQLDNLKTSKQLSPVDWGTNTVGVKFTNGISAIMAYNNDCRFNQFDNTAPVLNCISMLYDTNGFGKPNKISKDIHAINTNDRLIVIANINNVKITKIVLRDNIAPVDCTDPNGQDYIYCLGDSYTKKNYYAGTVKLCGGIENLPSHSDLLNIAKYLYNDDALQVDTEHQNKLKDTNRVNILGSYGFPTGNFQIWGNNSYHYTSSSDGDDKYAGLLYIYDDSNLYYSYCNAGGNPNTIAVCIKH